MDELPKHNIVMVWSQLGLSELNADNSIETQFDYKIVPDDKANPANGHFAESLPASQALLGRLLGEELETTIDDRPVRLRIHSVGQAKGM